MNQPGQNAGQSSEPSIIPPQGWHCLHSYYRFRRDVLAKLDESTKKQGADQFIEALDPNREGATQRLQVGVVSGHKADFGLMVMDPDPLRVDSVHQSILAGPLGPAVEATYSFVSLSEVSEYVMTVEQYADRLRREGEREDSPTFEAKLRGYEQRLPIMNRERLTPEFPDWPVTCFYPMNKIRNPHANWFTLPLSLRQALMSEHARSGMKFMGRVKQLITVSVGLDDWEWGVTLWANNPVYLKEIVYQMRFDEASAKYAEFGPFYTSYPTDAVGVLRHSQVVN